MIGWQIWHADPFGRKIENMNGALSFNMTLAGNAVGSFGLVMPAKYDIRKLGLDHIISFWEQPEGGRSGLAQAGFVRKIVGADDSSGMTTITLGGPDGNDLLQRRIIASYAGSGISDKATTPADDMMKEIIREQLGSSAGAGRDLSGMNFTVAADAGLGPQLSMGFSWKEVLETLVDIAESSRSAGTDLYFRCVPVIISQYAMGFQFQTYTGQPGRDVTDKVYFSKDFGNLANVRMTLDYTDEQNYIYAGGQGDGAERTIVEVSDSARINQSPWNRREAFTDAADLSTTDAVTDRAYEDLAAGRPLRKFEADLISTELTRFGIDWSWGDRVSCGFLGRYFPAVVSVVSLTVSDQGVTQIRARGSVGDFTAGGSGGVI